jgi:DNA ligase D-like protein (predicted 3'-phosphoesterase)
VETEDHPLAYGDFEGRIPDGEYGAGDSIIWDRGTYDTVPPGQVKEQRRKGHLHVVFDGEKLKGAGTWCGRARRAARPSGSSSRPRTAPSDQATTWSPSVRSRWRADAA